MGQIVTAPHNWPFIVALGVMLGLALLEAVILLLGGSLFGFVDDDEKSVFELLQTASGVGPKLAQAMLAVHSPDELRRAVTSEDVKSLTTVPGIGQKGAQRIILDGSGFPAIKLISPEEAYAAGQGPQDYRDAKAREEAELQDGGPSAAP